MEKVLLNDCVPQITTPFFKFFELTALCKNRRVDIAQEHISSYWGGMLRLGSTSVWEEYNPVMEGKEHYRMYDEPFGKSLCHAWGSGPICFLGRYVAGVRPTSAGYVTWEISPNPGTYKSIKATVPLSGGSVKVEYENGKLKVLADREGGVLIWKGKTYPIQKNKAVCVD